MTLDRFITAFFEENVPFSFRYGGKPAEGFKEKAEDQKGFTRTLLTDDGNLEAVLKVRRIGAAVEWWLELTGCGSFDSKIVDDLKYADITMTPGVEFGKKVSLPRLIWAHGSLAQPGDFMPESTSFNPAPTIKHRCDGGRSSDMCMPYFNLQLSEKTGVILAIGWSGQWQAEFTRLPDPRRPIRFTAEMDEASFRVEPGETLELPHVIALPWEGEMMDSFNAWRKVVRWNILPKYSGKPLEGCVGLRAWGGLTPEIHKSKFENAKKHGLEAEVYQIDAGWHGEGTEKSDNYFFDNWYLTIGTWKPLPAIYPDGMSGFGQACRDAGMELAVWFEPERMLSWNKAVNEHRDYFIGPRRPRDYEGDGKNASNMMVNLGNPQACRWITDQISSVIAQSGMKVFRLDFNYRPLDFWKYGDRSDRKGVTEIKYMAGLYKMLGDLLERHPGLQIDNCASGGRRLDYRMFRYGIPMFCRSDYFCGQDNHPDPKQAHTYGLSFWVPTHADSLGSCIGHTPEVMDTYRWRSSICSGIGATAPWWELTEEEAAWYRKMIRETKRVRPFMSEDFYPLTGYSLSDQDWMAWQMHMPAEEKGVIMAFRRGSSCASQYEFELKAIDWNGAYRLEDADEGELGQVSGAVLAGGYAFRIDGKNQSRILFYEKA